ncbi:MAG: hypothetical protein JF600_09705 [Xanthomonadales bacterium]|nr:hypothetical protein [Xanthomonadales bacterium]
MSTGVRAVVLTVGLLAAGAAAASGINGINGGMPNRISMNVTVPRQTQGATFGEKVNAGLHAAAGAVAQGARLAIACGPATCTVALPDGSGYRADLDAMTLSPLAAGQAVAPAGPGAGIVSAAVSSVGHLSGGGGSGAAAASYARTAAPAPLASQRRADGDIDVAEPLVDGDYLLTLVVEKATSGLKDTLKTQVRMAAPQRIRIDLVFAVEGGVLKARHETAKNAIGNVR